MYICAGNKNTITYELLYSFISFYLKKKPLSFRHSEAQSAVAISRNAELPFINIIPKVFPFRIKISNQLVFISPAPIF